VAELSPDDALLQVTISLSEILSSLSSQKSQSLFLASTIDMTLFPACLRALARAKPGPVPKQPLTMTTVPKFSIWLGLPSGPTMLRIEAAL